MPVTTYGGGTSYDGGDYGRVDSAIYAAQEARVRETGLKVSVTDENLNQWTYVAGQDWYAKDFADSGSDYTLTYKHYRGGSSACILSNGHIVRVRVGDGTQADRQIWVQEITDPENASAGAWTSWSVLYSGVHYSVSIYPSGSGYDIYDSRDAGIYKNNSLIWSHAGAIAATKIQGSSNAFFLGVVRKDNYVNDRDIEQWFTPNLGVTTPTFDPMNFRWLRYGLWGILLPDGRVARIQVNGLYNDPRAGAARGDTISVSFNPSITDNTPGPAYLIRGVGSDWGRNEINMRSVAQLADGYYYLFYNEFHVDESNNQLTEMYAPCMWQRSKDLLHWSEPVAMGISAYGALIESANYVWFLGNGAVNRRPKSITVYDLSNYVPELSLQIPRDNQDGSGSIPVVNLNGVNDPVLSLEGRKIKVEIGIKATDGQFQYAEFNDWWIKHVSREMDGAANRLVITLSDIWGRLQNPLRDTFNFVGQTVWDDWQAGKRNKAFNYFFVTDTAPVEGNTLSSSGIVLYTGWKGTNALASAYFGSGTPTLYFRYVDENNYLKVWQDGSNIRITSRVAGVNTNIDSASVGTFHELRAQLKWGAYQVWADGILKLSGIETDPLNVASGYVGFGAGTFLLANFHLEDWEPTLTTEDLIRTAVAMGDCHDMKVSSGGSRQVALIWGPQTDLPTPAEALKQLLETDKLQLIWRDGTLEVGKFTDPAIVKVIQDRVVSTNQEESENLRVNLAVVDGNEDSWIEIDYADSVERDRQLVGYYDLPELVDQDAVTARAKEEIRRGKLGSSPGGQVILYFDLWRMDAVTWIDNAGNSTDVRVEGIDIDIQQNDKPSQRMNLVTSKLDS